MKFVFVESALSAAEGSNVQVFAESYPLRRGIFVGFR